jgi:hypothetical protein
VNEQETPERLIQHQAMRAGTKTSIKPKFGEQCTKNVDICNLQKHRLVKSNIQCFIHQKDNSSMSLVLQKKEHTTPRTEFPTFLQGKKS